MDSVANGIKLLLLSVCFLDFNGKFISYVQPGAPFQDIVDLLNVGFILTVTE